MYYDCRIYLRVIRLQESPNVAKSKPIPSIPIALPMVQHQAQHISGHMHKAFRSDISGQPLFIGHWYHKKVSPLNGKTRIHRELMIASMAHVDHRVLSWTLQMKNIVYFLPVRRPII
jgi:hypothetical protein